MAERNAMNMRIVDGDDCCPQALCVKVCNLVQEVRSTGASEKLIPSEKAVSDAFKGRQELLVAGAAEGILGPSAATGLAQVLTAPSSGVSVIDAIKGRTLKWNQLVDDDTETVTVPSGHKYFALIGGVASVATSDGTALSVTGGTDNVVDLTDIFGAGNEPSTVADFTALFPNFPYSYNAGTLLPFKGTAMKATGFNQWDEQWERGSFNLTNGGKSEYANNFRSKNPIKVVQGASYYMKTPFNSFVLFYDINDNYLGYTSVSADGASLSILAGTAYMLITAGAQGADYGNNICINLSNASLNGTYKPYTETVLNIDAIGKTAKDADGNAIVPFPTGVNGDGTTSDQYGREGGTLRWGVREYEAGDESDATVITDGTNTVYPLAEDVPFTWDEPFTLAFSAEEGGTIWLLPEGVDAQGVPATAPLNADIAYTVPAGSIITETTLRNLLDEFKAKGIFSAYTMTPDGAGNFNFTITV